MSMKKFCFVTSATRNEKLVVPRRQAQTLVQEGYDVYFCVSDNGLIETIDDITYYPSGYSGGGYFKKIGALSLLMRKAVFSIDADIYQIESPSFLNIGEKLKKRGKKVLFSCLEGYPYNYYSKTKLPKLITHFYVSYLAQRMKTALKKYDAVFTVSEDIIEYMKGWGLNNIVLLGNFPEVNKNYQLSEEEYLNRENRVIYYGHIPSSSRQNNVIQAISEIKDVKYLLAGKFWSKEYQMQLQSLEGWQNVEFIDGFERSRLPEILSRCTISNTARDLSRTKSSNGSLGILKIFESMEAALPVILVDLPVYRKLVEEYNCGVLVDVNNVESIKEAIQYLVSHKEEAYKMGQNGRRAVIEKYSWDQVSKTYLSYVNN